MPEIELTVSEFVAVLNQTLDYAYPGVLIAGELANLRVSKNRWTYFDLKDDQACIHFFGTVYHLPGPLEDGMLLKVRARPQLHPQFGFSMNVMNIQLSGEGSIKKAADLLEAKLAGEGLFDAARKRALPYPPTHIGLVTSSEAAAYSDFTKVFNSRWGGVEIDFINVQVQGESAPSSIVKAIEAFNEASNPPEVLVITRGGGSPEDLAAFSTEQVTRAVAASRIPTLVAIGHERDVSLAEMAADKRASTPSNAAELLTPDRHHVLESIKSSRTALENEIATVFVRREEVLYRKHLELDNLIVQILKTHSHELVLRTQLLNLLDPEAPLRRGYALVRSQDKIIRSIGGVKPKQLINIQLKDGYIDAEVTSRN